MKTQHYFIGGNGAGLTPARLLLEVLRLYGPRRKGGYLLGVN